MNLSDKAQAHYCDWLHKGWGNRISVEWPNNPENAEYIEANGHFSGINKGDVILIRFQNGKIGRLPVEDIRYELDPNDMFFAKLGWDGYDNRSQDECEKLEPQRRFFSR